MLGGDPAVRSLTGSSSSLTFEAMATHVVVLLHARQPLHLVASTAEHVRQRVAEVLCLSCNDVSLLDDASVEVTQFDVNAERLVLRAFTPREARWRRANKSLAHQVLKGWLARHVTGDGVID